MELLIAITYPFAEDLAETDLILLTNWDCWYLIHIICLVG